MGLPQETILRKRALKPSKQNSWESSTYPVQNNDYPVKLRNTLRFANRLSTSSHFTIIPLNTA